MSSSSDSRPTLQFTLSMERPWATRAKNVNPVQRPRLAAPLSQTTAPPVREGPPPTKVLRFLYLGSVDDAKNQTFLDAENIKFIVNVSNETYNEPRGVSVAAFPIEDAGNAKIEVLFGDIFLHLAKIRRSFFDTRQRVLVHCQKGVSRSPTVVLAYLMHENGWSYVQALEFLSKKRPIVQPNLAFAESLRVWAQELQFRERNERLRRLSIRIMGLDHTRATPDVVSSHFSTYGEIWKLTSLPTDDPKRHMYLLLFTESESADESIRQEAILKPHPLHQCGVPGRRILVRAPPPPREPAPSEPAPSQIDPSPPRPKPKSPKAPFSSPKLISPEPINSVTEQQEEDEAAKKTPVEYDSPPRLSHRRSGQHTSSRSPVLDQS